MAKPTCKSVSALQILVVDDNDEFAHLFAKLLNDEGHLVETACDGPAALDAIHRTAPDVVFLDVGLPTMNGYEVAKRIRGELGLDKITLIAVTGYGGHIDKLRAKDAGFNGHLLKPTDFQLVKLIDALQQRIELSGRFHRIKGNG